MPPATAQARTQNAPLAAPDTAAAVEARLQAIEARYRRAIALAPEVASYHTALAEVLQRRGRTSEATASYAEAVRLDPQSSRNRALYGQFLLQQGDAANAVEHLRIATERDPRNPAYAEALATAYGMTDRWDDAAQALERAVELAPADSQYRHSLRAARAQAGIDVDAPIEASDEVKRPVLLRIIELTMGGIMTLAGVALVYPILSGIFLAGRTGAAMALGRT